MKYLLCLVALLLLCLSPKPSFGQPNTYLSLEEKWPYENFRDILGSLASLYWKNIIQYHKGYHYHKEIGTKKVKEERIARKKEFFSKVEDYIKGLRQENPQIVQVLLSAIAELNKRLPKGCGKEGIEHAEQHGCNEKTIEHAEQNLGKLLKTLAVISPYLSIEDIVHLERLDRYQVELMNRTREKLTNYGFKLSIDKLQSQAKSRSSSNSRKRRSNFSFEAKEKWPYEKYIDILGSLEYLYFKAKENNYHHEYLKVYPEQNINEIAREHAIISKVKDYIIGLRQENPEIVQVLLSEIAELNKRLLHHHPQHHPQLEAELGKLLNTLAAIIAYSPLEDIVHLDSLRPKQVEYIENAVKSTRQRSAQFSISSSVGGPDSVDVRGSLNPLWT